MKSYNKYTFLYHNFLFHFCIFWPLYTEGCSLFDLSLYAFWIFLFTALGILIMKVLFCCAPKQMWTKCFEKKIISFNAFWEKLFWPPKRIQSKNKGIYFKKVIFWLLIFKESFKNCLNKWFLLKNIKFCFKKLWILFS